MKLYIGKINEKTGNKMSSGFTGKISKLFLMSSHNETGHFFGKIFLSLGYFCFVTLQSQAAVIYLNADHKLTIILFCTR